MDDVKVHVSDVVSSSDIDDEDNFVDAKEEQSEDEEISEEEVSQDEDEDQSDDLDIDANSERIIKHVSKNTVMISQKLISKILIWRINNVVKRH